MAKEQPNKFKIWQEARKSQLEQPEPTITEAQFDLWIDQPVTQAFLKAMHFKREDEAESAGIGNIVDSSNSDLTHALIHRSLGRQDAYENACDPWEMLVFYELVDLPDPEPEEETNE